jgi:pimeloyl-ACP methyl ester carboxylesterase
MAPTDPTTLTNTFDFEDIYRIRWTRLGPKDGQPLIFIHGTPWSSRLWAPYALAFASSYSVYLFDNPGYGESQTFAEGTDEQAKDASLGKQAASFAALYRSWALPRPPHVIVHDNGGLVSLRAALLHGCVYRSLTLVDVVAVRPFGSPFFRLVAANPDVFNGIPQRMFDGIVRGYIRGAAHKPLSAPIENMLAAPWLSEDGQSGFIRQMVQASGRDAEDIEPRYGEIGASGIPVKIIWGKEDQWIPVDHAERLRSMIGGMAEAVVVEEAGHLIHIDQPERLMGELMKFILGVDK